MTVIATVISQQCVAHASDSLITNNTSEESISQEQSTKIICVPQWSGIISFWGTVKIGTDWTLLEFLRKQVELAKDCSGPEDFADMISEALSRFPAIISEGVGIHFTAYEPCDDILVPELFQITNLKLMGKSKYRVEPGEVHYRRETYARIAEQMKDDTPREEHGKIEYRRKVKSFLEEGGIYFYNNGDPDLFNMSLSGVFNMFEVAGKRGVLRPLEGTKDHRNLVTWPIEQVVKLQANFFLPKAQFVGGPVHNLSVTSDGKYESDTGDQFGCNDFNVKNRFIKAEETAVPENC